MHRARAEPFVKITKNLDQKIQIRRLQFIVHELTRLFRHPGLFPSGNEQVRFLAIVAIDSELDFREACGNLLIEAEIAKIDRISRESFARPLYVAGSKGWENFLLNMAPGAPEEPSQRAKTIPKSAFQIVPAVGMRVIADLEREEAEIVRYVQRASSNPLPKHGSVR